MNNISNIHKSPTFTILVIIFTFIGIISSFQYSKYKNSLFNESFKYSSAISKKNYSNFNNDYGRTDFDYERLKYSKYPIGSVPVKVVLGKIKKIENPYLPYNRLSGVEIIIKVNYYNMKSLCWTPRKPCRCQYTL